MASVVRLALFVVCVFAAPLVAAAQFRLATPAASFDTPSPPVAFPSSGLAGGGFGPGMGGYAGAMSPGGMPYRQRAARPHRPQQPQWVIPIGEYGLELADGTRMVGRPAKDWSAKIATTFGTVTIPLTQIAHIASAGNGQFAAFLKNGDRVSGSLVSNTMNFETKFGTLSVVATDIARLRSASPIAQPVAATSPAPANPRTLRGRILKRARLGFRPESGPRPFSGGIKEPAKRE